MVRLVTPAVSAVRRKMLSFRVKASGARMTSCGGKLTAPACHPTKKKTKLKVFHFFSEEEVCLFTN
jgi:hypothetical protein